MFMIEVFEKNSQDDRYNLGRMFMDCMLMRPKDDICQIDAGTEEQETNGSVLSRSILLAKSFRKLGLQPGDVLALGGKNHLDLHIPFYAALLEGLPIVGVDPFFKYAEIKLIFKLTQPKIAFCQNVMYEDYARAARDLGLDLKIVTFDYGDCTMKEFMETYAVNEPIEDYQPADFDTDKVYAWLVSTSGTSGAPKVAAFKHTILVQQIIKYIHMTKVAEKGRNALHLSPVQWISAYFNAIGMLLQGNCKVQTSTPEDVSHIIDIINKYRPVSLFTSPSLLTSIMKHEKHCDLTCFNIITLTGSKIFKDLLVELKSRLRPDSVLIEAYGQTETLGPALRPNPKGPIGSCGVVIPGYTIKLVVPDTGKDITEPNVTGELWYKGPLFSEYYNDPEATAEAFSADGFFKTGDLLYRDEEHNYFFVDRLKMLIKFRNYHIIPLELEEVIIKHPGVLEVAVTSIPHPDDGQHPVACVVTRPGCDVTAQEIKQLVADKLSAKKQLIGGVVFLDELPKTSTRKVARGKLNDIVLNARKE